MASSAPSRFRTWALIGFGTALIVALLILVWKLRTAQSPAPYSADRSQPVDEPGLDHQPEGLPQLFSRQGGEVGPALPEDPDNPAAPLASLLANTTRILRQEAAKCDPEEIPSDQRGQYVSVRYTAVFEEGWGTIEDVKPMNRTIEDQEILRCILEHVSNARWKIPRARKSRTPRVDSFAIGHKKSAAERQ